jgi:hypothetical protein
MFTSKAELPLSARSSPDGFAPTRPPAASAVLPQIGHWMDDVVAIHLA